MNKIHLPNLELKTFTEQDALDYCQLNNINPDNITMLNLFDNKLTDIDISGIKLFKNLSALYLNNNKITDISALKNLTNLKILYLSNNKIQDISVIQYLKNLQILNIDNLELNSDQIKYINSIKKLENIWCFKGFKDMSVLKQINKKIKIYE